MFYISYMIIMVGKPVFWIINLNDGKTHLRPIHNAQTNSNKQVGSSWLLDLESYEK